MNVTKRLQKTLLQSLLVLAGVVLCAGQALALGSPVGYWKTVDDKTKTVKSVVRIWKKKNGKYAGKIIRLTRKDNPKCTKCKGARKNKPIAGMTILWGLKKASSSYKGGKILDPANGKTYSCEIWTTKGGKRLKVKGCLIWPLCRTQTWRRAKAPAMKKKAVKKAPAKAAPAKAAPAKEATKK